MNAPKNLQELLEYLRSHNRTSTATLIEHYSKKNSFRFKESYSMSHAIDVGMSWSNTEEGPTYWGNIKNLIEIDEEYEHGPKG